MKPQQDEEDEPTEEFVFRVVKAFEHKPKFALARILLMTRRNIKFAKTILKKGEGVEEKGQRQLFKRKIEDTQTNKIKKASLSFLYTQQDWDKLIRDKDFAETEYDKIFPSFFNFNFFHNRFCEHGFNMEKVADYIKEISQSPNLKFQGYWVVTEFYLSLLSTLEGYIKTISGLDWINKLKEKKEWKEKKKKILLEYFEKFSNKNCLKFNYPALVKECKKLEEPLKKEIGNVKYLQDCIRSVTFNQPIPKRKYERKKSKA